MSTQTTAVQKTDKFTEIVPLGSTEAQKIKLSVDMVKSLIAVKTKSGKTCSDADAIKFIAMCAARRLNPFEGDAYLIGYDNRDKPDAPTYSLITAHQAFLKRAEINPEYDGMKSGIIVEREDQFIDLEGDFFIEGDKVRGGWATVFFKNRKQPMHKRVRLQRFQKSFGIWQDDPAGMICKCAEADALRSAFPTMLGGLYLREELKTDEPLKTVAPIFSEPPPAVVEAETETVLEERAPEPLLKTKKAAPKPAEPKPSPEPEVTSFEQAEEPSGMNRAKHIAGMCRLDGISEEQLLTFLKSMGAVEGGVKDIAGIPKDVQELVSDQWSDLSQRIKATIKA